MRNFEIARLFYEMANLLEVRGESVFRIRAYQRGAQTLETLSEDVGVLAERGALTTLPNIGKDLAAKIQEYLATGRIARLESLREGLAPTFLTLLEVRGLGPKTARALFEQLGIESIEQLEEACRTRRIVGVRPYSSAAASEAMSAAVAPSVRPAEFPAVTRPPARKGVRKVASASIVVSGRRNSSRLATVQPSSENTDIGTTMSSITPSSHAFPARRCDSTA